MKTFKRTLSCFLALLMIFGSFSVLSYAAIGDGNRKSAVIETRFFVDGVEVTEVNPGDVVKARVYITTDYAIGSTTFFWVYSKDFMELDVTGIGGDEMGYDATGVFNNAETSVPVICNLGGLFVYNTELTGDSVADDHVYDEYLTEEFFDDKGWIAFAIQTGTPATPTADNGNADTEDDHFIEFTFNVKDDAKGEGFLYIPEGSLMTPTSKYAYTMIQRAKSATNMGVNLADKASRLQYDIELNDTNTIKLAQPEAEKFAVTYSFAGDIPEGYETKVPEATEAEAGATISAPEVEIPEGYELAWTATGATLNADGTYTVGSGAVAFTGTWTKLAPTEYDVTYSFANAAPNNIQAPAAGKVVADGVIPAPAVEVPAGYELTWAVEGATQNADGSYTAGANDVSFVGTWSVKSYDLIYMVDGEVYSSEKVEFGKEVTVIGNLTKEGYTFSGWDKTGTFTMPAETVTISGTYAIDSYNVVYMVNGIVIHEAMVEYNSKVTLYDYTPEAGYEFSGWDKEDGFTMPASSVTVSGTTSKIVYNVTYSFANEGPEGIDVPANGTTTVGDVINPGITAPAGWIFRWNVQGATSNGDGTFTAAANDVVFVGNWTKKNYNVTYSFANAGPEGVNAPVPGTTSVGATIAAPAVEVPAGWTLTWAATGATKNDDGSYTAGANDVAFVGTWAKNSYTITYYLSEQDYADGKVYDTQTVEFGGAITPIADPKVDGMIFDAWDLDFPAAMPAENLEAVAIFTPIVVTFYDVWGDPITDYTMEVVTEITDADLPAEDDATAGEDVNFVEWRVDDEKLVTPYAVTADVDVYAYCTVDVVFYADEEMTEELYTLTVDFGHIYTEEDIASAGKPTKTGYSFDGWDADFVDSEAFQNSYAAPTFVANDYTVTFIVDGKPYGDSQTVEFGEEITAPEAPTKEGYTFKGWTDVEDGTTALDKLVMDEEGKIFYPVFEMNDYAFFSVDLYLMNTEGKYEATPSKTITENGLIGLTVTVDHDGWQQYIDDYFSADTSEEADNVYTGVIAEGGSLVLKLYYKRATVEITVNDKTDDYYIGEVIPAPEVEIPDGYELDGWVDENGDPVEVPYTVKENGNPTEIKPNIVPSTDTAYTVEIYLMNENGEYALADTDVLAGTTDTMATADYAAYAPEEAYYSADTTAEGTVTETKITGDGKAVLKLYFKRAQYDVTIDGIATKVYHGATITAPEATTQTAPAGYAFAGWNDGTIAAGATITVTEAITLEPYFTANDNTAYTVEIYLMNENGEYALADTDVLAGTTDTMATADYADYAPEEAYYSADTTAEGTVTETKITGDGKAVLKLFFARAQYDVTIDGVTTKVYHGATITAPETTTQTAPAGYAFAGWNDGTIAAGATITVTEAITLEPYFTANDNTAYTVEIYLMNENGEYVLADTDVLAGTTDTTATAAHADYAQDAWFTPAADGNVTEVTITGDGKATLKLYYARAQYDVTIDGVTTKVYHGATITAPETTTQTAPAGYAFAGWNDGTIAAGATITVTEAITLEPYFAEGAATYTVEIYLQDAEGNYAAPETKTVTGKTGDTVTIAHADYAQADYYLADDAQANEFTGTIAGDGSLVLKLYFKRATYDVIVDGNVVAEDVIHGAEVTLPNTSDNITEGNELAGWTDGKNTYEPGETIIVNGALDLAPVEKPSDATKYTISIYIMNVDGEYVGTSTVAYGTTGATQTLVADNSREGFTVNAEKSVLTAKIKGDGTTVLAVYYDRNLYKATFDGVEYQVFYGASLPEVEPAAQTGKEFLAWTPEVPETMPAEDLAFTSTWADAVYNIIYVINGEEYPHPYAAGAAVTPIEDPSVAGMTFIGWNKEIPAVMPAEDVIIVAKFEAAVFNVTFLDGDGREFDRKAVQYGDAIVLPITNPTKEYHVFKGWLDVPETMPAANITIYPDFERVPVRLVAAEGSTTVIDRSTMIITGLTTKMNDTKAAQYLAVEGDGYYTLTPASNYVGFYGTGAKVEVYDNADTSAPIEVFYIVIYGDVNGDSAVNSVDNSIVESEVLFSTNWSRGSEKDELRVMAADLNKDGKIKQGDADSILNSALGISTIDQATGNVTR